MRRAAVAFVFVGACAVLSGQASSDEFARAAEIRTTDGGAIFRVVLPDDVYDTVVRDDLGDIRVLNAAGDVVPHTLREAPRPPKTDAEWRPVPSFPMTEPQVGAPARTQVRIAADGAVLEVTNAAARGRQTTAYLVDTSALKTPLSRIALTWDAPPDATFLAAVEVSVSNDLDRWHTVVPSAAVAQLRRDAFTLTQNEIELPARGEQAKYFRVSWPKELAAVSVTAVRVRPHTKMPDREIRWRTLAAPSVESSTARYETRGRLPIEFVDLEFPDAADAVSVSVRSRAAPSADSRLRHRGVFYSLEESGATVRSSPARIAPTSDRYWSVESNRDRGWRPGRAPRLKLGWHPHELLFLAQGQGPYTLVYGSARIAAAEAPVDAVLAALENGDRNDRVRQASLGTPRSLAGEAALRPAPPVRRIALWSVLVVAVALLALMAVRLFREAAEPR